MVPIDEPMQWDLIAENKQCHLHSWEHRDTKWPCQDLRVPKWALVDVTKASALLWIPASYIDKITTRARPEDKQRQLAKNKAKSGGQQRVLRLVHKR
jgi:hypothetical protein